MRLIWATVTAVAESDAEVQRLRVMVDGGAEGDAVCYLRLVGECREGDRVIVNTTAVDLGLGTGGAHFVVAREAGGAGTVLESTSGGHVLKLRYTPLQVDVMSVESPESPHHETMRTATSLEGMPVVCCGLHSHVPLVAAAIKRGDPNCRVAYCMTDEAALAVGLSRVMSASRRAGLVDTTVTCGQSFGGDLEAVNLYSGLLAARHVARADIAIVSLGPGVVGTATPFGHGGVSQGQSINAASALGGRPVACLRVSFADERDRHRGVSHHTVAALVAVAQAPATVAIPRLDAEKMNAIEDELDSAGVWSVHSRQESIIPGSEIPDLRGVEVTTMGRHAEDDPDFFSAAFAAGDIAFRMVGDVLSAQD